MDNILMVVGRLVCTILVFVLAVLVRKTVEYFNGLPENDKVKPLLAWDVLMLFLLLIFLVVRLVIV